MFCELLSRAQNKLIDELPDEDIQSLLVGGFVLLREIAKGLIKYQPDVIVSVHPLMQHIPLRVLRARGLLHKIPFTTVITDLSTCHPTWYDTILLLEWPWSFGKELCRFIYFWV